MKRFLPYAISGFILLFLLLTHAIRASASEDSYFTLLLKNNKDSTKIANQIKENGGEIVYTIEEIGLIQFKANKEESGKIGTSSLVDTYNPSVRTSDPPIKNADTNPNVSLPELWDFQWDMKEITNNGKSYDLFSGSKNVTVGIVDSGITANHPDLSQNVVPGSKNLVPKNGFRGSEPSETGELTQISDLTGHGTFVAGQVAANGLTKGVAPNIGIKSYRVFGNGSADSAWIIKAIVEAAKDNVDVINLSLGDYLIKGVTYTYEGKSKKDLAEIKAYEKAIKFAYKQGSIVVSAVGNDNLDLKDKNAMNKFMKDLLAKEGISFKGTGIDVPASLPHVVTVGSTGPTQELSLFSNYGSGFIDIAAPGGDLRLLKKYGSNIWINEFLYQQEMILGASPNGAYTFNEGTSLAAPKVSGALALIIDKNNYKKKPNKAIRYLYSHGADPRKKDKQHFGHGILNVYKALK